MRAGQTFADGRLLHAASDFCLACSLFVQFGAQVFSEGGFDYPGNPQPGSHPVPLCHPGLPGLPVPAGFGEDWTPFTVVLPLISVLADPNSLLS